MFSWGSVARIIHNKYQIKIKIIKIKIIKKVGG